ncbi:hypothetical protein AVEN_66844-1 [Araneus ventricosus]|uniref:Uncharacterized protein n=1 Tax=Araneus ventricosus TaxID=182803 RepID=A0A4Y2DR43_ARAVE|nr:hypothetical protein AVEN_66844-1 [Araneus ventricosus]
MFRESKSHHAFTIPSDLPNATLSARMRCHCVSKQVLSSLRGKVTIKEGHLRPAVVYGCMSDFIAANSITCDQKQVCKYNLAPTRNEQNNCRFPPLEI